LDYPSVRAINERFGDRVTWFCGVGSRQWFLDAGIVNVVELTWWQQWQHPVGESTDKIVLVYNMPRLDEQRYSHLLLSCSTLVSMLHNALSLSHLL
jgi:hypothetical protein